jgi:hypothetical protein
MKRSFTGPVWLLLEPVKSGGGGAENILDDVIL